MEGIIAIDHKIEDIGKRVGFTKVEYFWEFKIKNTTYILIMYHSRLTMKFEVLLNGNSQTKSKTLNYFQYSFTILNNLIEIKPKGIEYELFINNTSFLKILKDHKNQIKKNEKINNYMKRTSNTNINVNKNFKKRYTTGSNKIMQNNNDKNVNVLEQKNNFSKTYPQKQINNPLFFNLGSKLNENVQSSSRNNRVVNNSNLNVGKNNCQIPLENTLSSNIFFNDNIKFLRTNDSTEENNF